MSGDLNGILDDIMVTDAQRRQRNGPSNSPQKRANFSDMSDEMLKSANELKIIIEEKIPVAFPISEPKGGTMPGHVHSPFEFMFAGWKTDLDDGMFAIDIIQEIIGVFEGLKLLIHDLYPNKMFNGTMEVDVKEDFEHQKMFVEEALNAMAQYKNFLEESMGESPIDSVNKDEMHNLNNHVTRLGVEFYSKRKIPDELCMEDESSMVTLEMLARTPPPVAPEMHIQDTVSSTGEMVLFSPGGERSTVIDFPGTENIFGDFNDRAR
jgi:hypothetical protein